MMVARKRKDMTKSNKTKEAPTTLAEKAYELIKGKIISAEYVPGQFLQEAQISKELNLGRTPVHNALHRLKQEGMLEIIPRKGIVVQTDSLSEIYLALETRKLVEPYCASMCATRRTTEQFQNIADVCHKLESNENLEKRERMELDRRFHGLVAQAAGNHFLADFLRSVHDRMSRIWFLPTWHFHDYDLTNTEHRNILNAIENRDANVAAEAMSVHIDSLRRSIMAASPN